MLNFLRTFRQKNILKITALVALMIVGGSVWGETTLPCRVQNNISGNWEDYTSWKVKENGSWRDAKIGEIPDSTTSVYLDGGGSLSINSNVTVAFMQSDKNFTLTIKNGASLNLTKLQVESEKNITITIIIEEGGTLVLSDAVKNSGSLKINNNGTFEYKGNNDQVVISNPVWNGKADTIWTNEENWVNKNVPTTTSQVTIPANCTNYPSLNSALQVSSINIAEGASLSLNNQSINVTNLYVNGTLRVKGSESLNTTITYGTNSTLEFYGGADNLTYNGTSFATTYGATLNNFSITENTKLTVDNDLVINGTFNIKGQLRAYKNLTISGDTNGNDTIIAFANVTLNGPNKNTTPKIKLDGDNVQTITCPDGNTFKNFVVGKNGGSVNFANSVSFSNFEDTSSNTINYTFNNDVTFSSAATLKDASTTFADGITLTSTDTTFNNAVFKGSATLKGSNTFTDFTATDLGGETLTINDTQTVKGILTLTGTDASNKLSVTGTGTIALSSSQTSGQFLSVTSTGPTISTSTYAALDSVVDPSSAAAPAGWIIGDTNTNIWLGTDSTNPTDWNTATNWSKGTVPNGTDVKVYIPNTTNKPVITTDISVESIIFGTGATLTVNNAGSLTINSDFTLSDQITGSGKIVVPAGVTCEVPAAKTNIAIENNGTVVCGDGATFAYNFTNNADATFTAGSGTVLFCGNADFSNSTAGKVNFSNEVYFYNLDKDNPITFKTFDGMNVTYFYTWGNTTVEVDGTLTAQSLQMNRGNASGINIDYDFETSLTGKSSDSKIKVTGKIVLTKSSNETITGKLIINVDTDITDKLETHTSTTAQINSGKTVTAANYRHDSSTETQNGAVVIQSSGKLVITGTMDLLYNKGSATVTVNGELEAGTIKSTTASDNNIITNNGNLTITKELDENYDSNSTGTLVFNGSGATWTKAATVKNVEIKDTTIINCNNTITGSFTATNLENKTLTINGKQTVNGTLALSGKDESNHLSIDGTGSFVLNRNQLGGQYLTLLSATGPVISDGTTAGAFTYTAANSSATTNAPSGWILSSAGINTWKGGTTDHETDWSTATNWSNNSVPDTDELVYIPGSPASGKFPVIGNSSSESISILKINIDSNASLTVKEDSSLSITSDFTLSENLSGDGKLIVPASVTCSVPATTVNIAIENKGIVDCESNAVVFAKDVVNTGTFKAAYGTGSTTFMGNTDLSSGSLVVAGAAGSEFGTINFYNPITATTDSAKTLKTSSTPLTIKNFNFGGKVNIELGAKLTTAEFNMDALSVTANYSSADFTATISGGEVECTSMNITRVSATDNVIGTLKLSTTLNCTGMIQTHSGTSLVIPAGNGVTTKNLEHSAGANPYTKIDISGNLTVTERFNLQNGAGSTEVFVKSTGTLSANEISPNNGLTFTKADSVTGDRYSITNNGTIEIGSTLNLPASFNLLNNGTIQKTTTSTGAAFTFAGTYAYESSGTLEVDGGSVTNTTREITISNLTLKNNTTVTGTSKITVSSLTDTYSTSVTLIGTVDLPGVKKGDVTVGNSTTAGTVTFTSAYEIDKLTITKGSLTPLANYTNTIKTSFTNNAGVLGYDYNKGDTIKFSDGASWNGTALGMVNNVTFLGDANINCSNTIAGNFTATGLGGKTLTFTTGTTQTISKKFEVSGSAADNLLTLTGTGEWNINVSGNSTTYDVNWVKVKNSKSSYVSASQTLKKIVAQFSKDDGGNTDWIFTAEFKWNGSKSTDWDEQLNWYPNNFGAPGDANAVVTIPAGCDNYPVLGSTEYTIKSLALTDTEDETKKSSLTLGSAKLKVADGSTGLSNAGTIIFTNAGRITDNAATPALIMDNTQGTVQYGTGADSSSGTISNYGATDYNNLVIASGEWSISTDAAIVDNNIVADKDITVNSGAKLVMRQGAEIDSPCTNNGTIEIAAGTTTTPIQVRFGKQFTNKGTLTQNDNSIVWITQNCSEVKDEGTWTFGTNAKIAFNAAVDVDFSTTATTEYIFDIYEGSSAKITLSGTVANPMKIKTWTYSPNANSEPTATTYFNNVKFLNDVTFNNPVESGTTGNIEFAGKSTFNKDFTTTAGALTFKGNVLLNKGISLSALGADGTTEKDILVDTGVIVTAKGDFNIAKGNLQLLGTINCDNGTADTSDDVAFSVQSVAIKGDAVIKAKTITIAGTVTPDETDTRNITLTATGTGTDGDIKIGSNSGAAAISIGTEDLKFNNITLNTVNKNITFGTGTNIWAKGTVTVTGDEITFNGTTIADALVVNAKSKLLLQPATPATSTNPKDPDLSLKANSLTVNAVDNANPPAITYSGTINLSEGSADFTIDREVTVNGNTHFNIGGSFILQPTGSITPDTNNTHTVQITAKSGSNIQINNNFGADTTRFAQAIFNSPIVFNEAHKIYAGTTDFALGCSSITVTDTTKPHYTVSNSLIVRSSINFPNDAIFVVPGNFINESAPTFPKNLEVKGNFTDNGSWTTPPAITLTGNNNEQKFTTSVANKDKIYNITVTKTGTTQIVNFTSAITVDNYTDTTNSSTLKFTGTGEQTFVARSSVTYPRIIIDKSVTEADTRTAGKITIKNPATPAVDSTNHGALNVTTLEIPNGNVALENIDIASTNKLNWNTQDEIYITGGTEAKPVKITAPGFAAKGKILPTDHETSCIYIDASVGGNISSDRDFGDSTHSYKSIVLNAGTDAGRTITINGSSYTNIYEIFCNTVSLAQKTYTYNFTIHAANISINGLSTNTLSLNPLATDPSNANISLGGKIELKSEHDFIIDYPLQVLSGTYKNAAGDDVTPDYNLELNVNGDIVIKDNGTRVGNINSDTENSKRKIKFEVKTPASQKLKIQNGTSTNAGLGYKTNYELGAVYFGCNVELTKNTTVKADTVELKEITVSPATNTDNITLNLSTAKNTDTLTRGLINSGASKLNVNINLSSGDFNDNGSWTQTEKKITLASAASQTFNGNSGTTYTNIEVNQANNTAATVEFANATGFAITNLTILKSKEVKVNTPCTITNFTDNANSKALVIAKNTSITNIKNKKADDSDETEKIYTPQLTIDSASKLLIGTSTTKANFIAGTTTINGTIEAAELTLGTITVSGNSELIGSKITLPANVNLDDPTSTHTFTLSSAAITGTTTFVSDVIIPVANTTYTGTAIFKKTLKGNTTTKNNLTISGNVEFDANVSDFANLTIGGTTSFANATSQTITTSAKQTYSDNISITKAVTLEGSEVELNKSSETQTVSGTNGTLTLNTDKLTVSQTSTFSVPVTLSKAIEITNTNSKGITFNKTTGTTDKTITNTGIITFNEITVTSPLVNNGTVNCTGNVTFNETYGTSTDKAGIFNAGAGTVTFNKNIDFSKTTFAHNNGTINLAPSGASLTINGSTTFYNLICDESSASSQKTIKFTAGTTQTVDGKLTLKGKAKTDSDAAILLKLRSTSDNSAWNIKAKSHDVSNVDLKDSHNTPSTGYEATLYAVNSEDNGNNINWNFPGHAYTWKGGTTDKTTDWFTATNWTPASVPGFGANVTIQKGLTNYPVLTGDVNLNGSVGASSYNGTIIVEAKDTAENKVQATFDIADKNLTAGTITNNGLVRIKGVENQIITGTMVNGADSTVEYYAEGTAKTVNLLWDGDSTTDGNQYENLVITNTTESTQETLLDVNKTLVINGTTTLAAPVKVAQTVSINAATELKGKTEVTDTTTINTTGNVTLNNENNSFSGNVILTAEGTVTLQAASQFSLAGGASCGTLNVNSAVKLLGDVTTTDNQTYTGAVTAGKNNVTLTAEADKLIKFENTVTGTPKAPENAGDETTYYNLTITTTNAEFDDDVSNFKNISVDGTTTFARTVAQTITSTGTQTYTGAVTRSAAKDITFANTGLLWFKSTLTGSGADLTVNGNVQFNADVSAFKDISVAGSTDFAKADSQTITSTGTQTYTGAVTRSIAKDIIFANTGLLWFKNTLTGTAGANLTVNGNVQFDDNVSDFANLTIGGTTSFANATSQTITTSAKQTYSDNISITKTVTLEGSVVELNKASETQTVSGTNGTLALNTDKLTVSQTTNVSVPVSLSKAIEITTTNSKVITFNKTTGTTDKAITNTGIITFNGITVTSPLVNNGTVNCTGNVTFNETYGTSTDKTGTFNAGAGTVTFNKNVDLSKTTFAHNSGTMVLEPTETSITVTGSGSQVYNTVQIKGNVAFTSANTFANLEATDLENKTITFPAGSTNVQNITETLKLTGTANETGKRLILKSSSDAATKEACFYINFTGTVNEEDPYSPLLQYVDMKNGYNITVEADSKHIYLTARASEDSGNNHFWNFAGLEYIWTGASDTNWFNESNWNRNSVPAMGTDVVIPASASITNWPTLDYANFPAGTSKVSVGNKTTDGDPLEGTITVENGATFDLTDESLAAKTITNNGLLRLEGISGQTIHAVMVNGSDSTVEYYNDTTTNFVWDGDASTAGHQFNKLLITGNADVSEVADVTGTTTINTNQDVSLTGKNTFTDVLTIENGDHVILNSASGFVLKEKTGATLSTLTVQSPVNLASDIKSSTSQLYQGDVVLNTSLTIETPDLTFNKTVNSKAGTEALDIKGSVTFNGEVGNNKSLTTLSVNGTSLINTGAITTSGTQTYQDTVTVDKSTTLSGSTITFDSTVDSNDKDETLKVSGNAVFNDEVGSAKSLESLEVTGTTLIKTDAITTSKTQLYNGTVTIDESTNLTGSTVTFEKPVDAKEGNETLTISGNAEFNDKVGSTKSLESLEITGTTLINTDAITTSTTQLYNDSVTVDESTTLTGSIVTFEKPVDAKEGNETLKVSGNAVFNNEVGSTKALKSLEVIGTTLINTDVITTSETQLYNGTVTVDEATNLTGSTVTFNNKVDSNNEDETLKVTGNAVFNNEVGSEKALVSLEITGTTLINTDSITTSTTQLYNGDVTVDSSTNLTGSKVTFNNKVDANNEDETLTISGNAVFNDKVGSTKSLKSLEVTGTSLINTDVITTSTTQLYQDAVTVDESTTLTGSIVTFEKPVDAKEGNETLTISGNAVFNDKVGSTKSLESLEVTETTLINTDAITTSTTQLYQNAVTVDESTTLTGSTVTFNSTVDTNNEDETLTISGNAVFNDKVGSAKVLVSLEITGTSVINTDSIKTSTTQLYNGDVTVESSTTLTGSTVTFNNKIDSTDESQTLTVSGDAEFHGNIGSKENQKLASLEVTGTTALNSVYIYTTENQTYTKAVTIGTPVIAPATTSLATLSGTAVYFTSTVDSKSEKEGLRIEGKVEFADTVGAIKKLASLEVTGTTAIKTTDINTTGNQTYTGVVTLHNASQVTADSTSNITLVSNIDGSDYVFTFTSGNVLLSDNVEVAPKVINLTTLTAHNNVTFKNVVQNDGTLICKNAADNSVTFEEEYKPTAANFFNAGAGTVTFNKNIDFSKTTFAAQNGTIILDPTATLITVTGSGAQEYNTVQIKGNVTFTSSNTFNTLEATDLGNKTIIFPIGNENKQVIKTTLKLTGTDEENKLKVKSSSATTTSTADCFYLKFDGIINDSETPFNPLIKFVDMENGYNATVNAASEHINLTLQDSEDSGNNWYWNFLGLTYIWTGSTSTDWFTEANWNRNSVPGLGTTVLINEKYNDTAITNWPLLDHNTFPAGTTKVSVGNKTVNNDSAEGSITIGVNAIFDIDDESVVARTFTNNGLLRIKGAAGQYITVDMVNGPDSTVEYYAAEDGKTVNLLWDGDSTKDGNQYENLVITNTTESAQTTLLEVLKTVVINGTTTLTAPVKVAQTVEITAATEFKGKTEVTGTTTIDTAENVTLNNEENTFTDNVIITNGGTVTLQAASQFSIDENAVCKELLVNSAVKLLGDVTTTSNQNYAAEVELNKDLTLKADENTITFNSEVTGAALFLDGNTHFADGNNIHPAYVKAANTKDVNWTSATTANLATDLYVDCAANTINFNGNLTANNIYLYNGNVTIENITLKAAENFVVWGANYSAVDKRYSSSNTRFKYFTPEDFNFAYTIDPSTATTTFGTLAGNITADVNFYLNGTDLPSVILNLPDNSASNPVFNTTDKATEKQWGIPYAVIFNSKITEVTANGGYVTAAVAQGNTDGTGNTNIQFTEPKIEKAYTVYDDVVYVEFNMPLENSNNEINTNLAAGTKLAEGGLWYNNKALRFAPVAYKNADCTEAYTTEDEPSYFYLRTIHTYDDEGNATDIGNATSYWNTDADGLNAYSTTVTTATDSTDRNGYHHNITVDLSFLEGLFTAADGHTMSNNYGINYEADGTTEAARYTDTEDQCSPVLIAAYLGQETHETDPSKQEHYDAHNFIELRYSEPVNISDGTTSLEAANGDKNIQTTTSLGNITGNGTGNGLEPASKEGLEIANLVTLNKGQLNSANKKDSTSPHAMYRNFTTTAGGTAEVQTNRIRISIAGYVDGTIDSHNNWVGYIDYAKTPAASVETDEFENVTTTEAIAKAADNANIKDLSGNSLVISKTQNHYINSDLILNKGIPNETVNPIYGSWDTLPPVFSPLIKAKSGFTHGEYEILPTGNGTVIDKIELHILDGDYQDENTYFVFAHGWSKHLEEMNPVTKYYYELIPGFQAADSFGGSRPFENGTIRTSGGVRYSSIVNQEGAFKYTATKGTPDKNFVSIKTGATANYFSGSNDDAYPIPQTDDNPYISLGINEGNYNYETTFKVSYDKTNSFITDLAGNRLNTNLELKSLDRTPPDYSFTLAPIGGKEIYIVFTKALDTENVSIMDEDGNEHSYDSVFEVLPKIIKFGTINGSWQEDSNIQIESAEEYKPFTVLENSKSDNEFTGIKLTLKEPITLEDVTSKYIRIEYTDEIGQFATDRFTNLIGSRITYIQANEGVTYMQMFKAHPLSDFAINAINPLYAYNPEYLADDGTIMMRNPENEDDTGSWAVHSWGTNQGNYGTLPYNAPINLITDRVTSDQKYTMYLSSKPDTNSISNQFNSDFDDSKRIWLPSIAGNIPFDAISENLNSNYVTLIETSDPDFDAAETPTRTEYKLTAADITNFGWKAGDQIKFLFSLDGQSIMHTPSNNNDGTSYTGQTSPIFALRTDSITVPDVTTLDLWSFRLKDFTYQRGGVSIFNNVINVYKAEKTVIKVNMPKTGHLKVIVMTLDGNVIKYLENTNNTSGEHVYYWDGTNKNGNKVARGMYFVRVIGEGLDETRKVMCVNEK